MSREPRESFNLPPNVDPEKHITRPFKCPSCGYDLRFATIAGTCSECGELYNSRTTVAGGTASLRATPLVRDDIHLPPGVSPERHIVSSLFCAKCGYSLKYATLVGRCAECGHEYNARSLLMTGIFSPGSVRLPIWETLVGAIILWFGFSMIWRGLSPVATWSLVIGGAATALGLACFAAAFREVVRLIRFRPVLRRIRGVEDEFE